MNNSKKYKSLSGLTHFEILTFFSIFGPTTKKKEKFCTHTHTHTHIYIYS